VTAEHDPTVWSRAKPEQGLPRPLLFDGTVRIDARERELVVRPAAHARGLAKYYWAETVRTMAEKPYGSLDPLPTPWASDAGSDRISYGLPGRDGALRFRFYPGHPNYKTLVTTPGLMARIALDRTSGRISVTFRGRR
jgi:hypothetical protein